MLLDDGVREGRCPINVTLSLHEEEEDDEEDEPDEEDE